MAVRRKPGFFANAPARFFAIVASAITFLVSVIGTAMVIDERYAHAGNVEQKLDQLQRSQNSSMAVLRKQQIEDRVFELDMKGSKQNDFDRALLQRYRQQLNEVNRSLEQQHNDRRTPR